MTYTNANNAIIFDWDDSLLCTTELARQGYIKQNEFTNMCHTEQFSNTLTRLEEAVKELISLALESSKDVYIITNATAGWVEVSCQRFLPSLLKLLFHVEIISAQQESREQALGPIEWKTFTFCNKKDRFEGLENVVSIGDSQCERLAILELGKKLPESTVKSVKMADQPTIVQLQYQLKLLINIFITHVSGKCSCYQNHNVPVCLLMPKTPLDLEMSITFKTDPLTVAV